MRNLVAYRQSVTLSTGGWNYPRRKDGDNWNKIKNVGSICDRYDGSLRYAILRLEEKMRRLRNKNNQPIWKCRMSARKVGKYRVYYLTCKRIRHILV